MNIKKYKNIMKGITALVLFFLSSTIQRLFVMIFGIKKITNTNAVILNFSSSFIILLCLLFLYQKELKKEWNIFKKNLADNMDIGLKYWLLGLAGMMVSNITLSILFQNDGADNEQLVQQMITALPILMVFSAGFIAPIVEEITFRKVFRDNIKKDILFILVSGIFFGFFASIFLLVSLILGVPVFLEYFDTGLVPRFPSLIVSGIFLVISLLLWITGIILDVIVKKHHQLYELMMNDLARKE